MPIWHHWPVEKKRKAQIPFYFSLKRCRETHPHPGVQLCVLLSCTFSFLKYFQNNFKYTWRCCRYRPTAMKSSGRCLWISWAAGTSADTAASPFPPAPPFPLPTQCTWRIVKDAKALYWLVQNPPVTKANLGDSAATRHWGNFIAFKQASKTKVQGQKGG